MIEESSPDRERQAKSTAPGATVYDAACQQCRVKKVRCDKEQPTCSNCKRSKLDCDWTNKGRKPNQTKKLVDDFDKVEAGLLRVERSILQNTTAIEKLLGQQPNLLLPKQMIARNPNSVVESTQTKDQLHASSSQDGCIVTRREGEERLHGSCSLLALLIESSTMIDSMIQPRLSLKAMVSSLTDESAGDEDLPTASSWDEFLSFKSTVYRKLSHSLIHHYTPDYSQDGQVLVLPSKVLLSRLVQGYYKHIHPVTPLVAEDHLVAAIDLCYLPQHSGSQDANDLAWTVIFNYVVIRCIPGHFTPLEHRVTNIDFASADASEQPFITNIRRAFAKLDYLMKPKLVNVQALLSLVIISQKHFSIGTTEMLLQRACNVAKTMGLHRRSDCLADMACADIDERQHLFWLLYTVDKDFSMVVGNAPYLQLYDCDCNMPPPNRTHYDQMQRVTSGRIKEKVYQLLYSASAEKGIQREAAIGELEAEVEQFSLQQDEADSEDDNSGWRGKPFLRVEMKFIYYHMRVMILRCSVDGTRRSKCQEAARQSIKLMAKIRIAKTTVGGFMVLRRPFQWHTFAPFFELLSALFDSTTALSARLEDFELLRSCVEMLREVAIADSPTTYCGSLLRVASACIEVGDHCIQQHQANETNKRGAGVRISDTLVNRPQRPKRKVVQGDPSFDVDQQLPNKRTSSIDVEAPPLQYQSAVSAGQFNNLTSQLSFLGDELPLDLLFHQTGAAQDNQLSLMSDDLMWGDDDLLTEMQTTYWQ